MSATKEIGDLDLLFLVDLAKDKKIFLSLVSCSIFLSIVVTWFFCELSLFIRPEWLQAGSLLGPTWWLTWAFVIVSFVWLHEAIHGIFFYIFTEEKPRFKFRPHYACASVPECFLGKWEYVVSAISPLVFITLLGLLLMFVVPVRFVIFVICFLVLNTAGSVGDIYISLKVALIVSESERAIRVNDTGTKVTVYG